jgi:hypothetical protein
MTQQKICFDGRALFCPRVNAIGSRLRRNAVFVSRVMHRAVTTLGALHVA